MSRVRPAAKVTPDSCAVRETSQRSSLHVPRIDGSEPTHVFLIRRRPDDRRLDLAIGEPAMVVRGLGTRALALFLERIVFADPAITACVSDPEARNPRSVRAFEKAGFAVLRTVVLSGERAEQCIVQRLGG
jgi:RimJ/RimL family protein N-acetyltransferase